MNLVHFRKGHDIRLANTHRRPNVLKFSRFHEIYHVVRTKTEKGRQFVRIRQDHLHCAKCDKFRPYYYWVESSFFVRAHVVAHRRSRK
jgi:hypothetical protein